jgi:membrane protein implicated in regulation of membrane protease activity
MYLSRVAASMWRSKWACLLLTVLSIALALFLTYRVSFMHGSLQPRHLSFGVAQASLLVDSGNSPLADSTVLTEDIDTLSYDLAEMMGSAVVLDPVAKAVGVPATKIYAQSQIVGGASLFQSEAGESERGNQLLGAGRHYSILARVDQSSFVVQLFTQAPTGAQAVTMANVAAQSLRRYIAQTAASERISMRRRVILRQIGPATGGIVDSSLPAEAATLLSIVFLLFSTIALLVIKRWRRARRTDGASASPTTQTRS